MINCHEFLYGLPWNPFPNLMNLKMESSVRLIKNDSLQAPATHLKKRKKEKIVFLFICFCWFLSSFYSTIDPNIPFTTTWFETYKDQLLEASSKGPVLVHCRDSSRAGTFNVVWLLSILDLCDSVERVDVLTSKIFSACINEVGTPIRPVNLVQ